MSFLGSIGQLMAGSGLHDTLETIYAEQAVTHILSGKAINRAVRGHILVDAALHSLLIEKAFHFPLPLEGSHTDNTEDERDGQLSCTSSHERMENAGKLFDALLSHECTVENVTIDQNLEIIKTELAEKREAQKRNRITTLWIQYMRTVAILTKFIKAERTGNWNLHLQAVLDMLPYFAASGQNLYAKSSYLYLQSMLSLPSSHP